MWTDDARNWRLLGLRSFPFVAGFQIRLFGSFTRRSLLIFCASLVPLHLLSLSFGVTLWR